jgi:hypothetical protein
VVAVLWLLFLPQDLANDPGHKHFNVVGAVIWVAVSVALLGCACVAWRRYRREHDRKNW